MRRRPVDLDELALWQLAHIAGHPGTSDWLEADAPERVRRTLTLESLTAALELSPRRAGILDDLRLAVSRGYLPHDWLDFAEHVAHSLIRSTTPTPTTRKKVTS